MAMLCTRCQIVDRPTRARRGSGCVALLLCLPGLLGLVWAPLFLLFFLPVVYVAVALAAPRSAAVCRSCGSAELVPTSSPRAMAALEAGQALPLPPGERAVLLARGLNQRPLLVVLVAGALGMAVCAGRGRDAPPPESAHAAPPPPAPSPPPSRPAEPPRVRVLADGLALAEPRAGAEPVLRLTAGESYARGERRDGWVRLDDAPVESWAPESSVEAFTPPPK